MRRLVEIACEEHRQAFRRGRVHFRQTPAHLLATSGSCSCNRLVGRLQKWRVLVRYIEQLVRLIWRVGKMDVEQINLPAGRERELYAPLPRRRADDLEPADDARALPLIDIIPTQPPGNFSRPIWSRLPFRSNSGRLLQSHDIGLRLPDDLHRSLERLFSCITSVPEIEAHHANGFRHRFRLIRLSDDA